MTTINKLSRIDSVSSGDLTLIWATNNGDDRAASMSVLLEYMQDNLVLPGKQVNQYISPDADSFEIQITAGTTWVLCTPTATRANGSLILPPAPSNNDEIVISTTQELTNLTIRSTVVTVPFSAATLAANGARKIKYNTQTANWYIVG